MGKPNVNVIIGAYQKAESTYKKIILKGGMPFAPQLTDDTCIYVVKYDFDLGGEEATMPANSILDFDGGSLKNGKLVLDNTLLDGAILLGSDLDVTGVCANQTAYQSWFEGNDVDAWHKFINNIEGPATFEYTNGIWHASVLIDKQVDSTIQLEGNGAEVTFDMQFNNSAAINLYSSGVVHSAEFASAAHKGDIGVVVSEEDFALFDIGDFVILADTATSSYHWTRNYSQGECACIRSKDETTNTLLLDHAVYGDYINIEGAYNFQDAYVPGNRCFISSFKRIDADIHNLTLRAIEVAADNFSAYKMSGVKTDYAKLNLSNVKCYDFANGMSLYHVYGGSVENCDCHCFVKCTSDSYGISVVSGQDLTINGGSFFARRHGISLSCQYGGNVYNYVCRFITVSNTSCMGNANKDNAAGKDGIECHCGEHIFIKNNTTVGIMVQLGSDFTISDNYVYNTITYFPKDFTLKILNNTILGGQITFPYSDSSYNSYRALANYSSGTLLNWAHYELSDNVLEQAVIEGNTCAQDIRVTVSVRPNFYPNLPNVTFVIKDNNAKGYYMTLYDNTTTSDPEKPWTTGGANLRVLNNHFRCAVGRAYCKDFYYSGNVVQGIFNTGETSWGGLNDCASAYILDNVINSTTSRNNALLCKGDAVISRNTFNASSITATVDGGCIRFTDNVLNQSADGILLKGSAATIDLSGNNVVSSKLFSLASNTFTRDSAFSLYINRNTFVDCSTAATITPVADVCTAYAYSNHFKACSTNLINLTTVNSLYTLDNSDELDVSELYIVGNNQHNPVSDEIYGRSRAYNGSIETPEGSMPLKYVPQQRISTELYYNIVLREDIGDYSPFRLHFMMQSIGWSKEFVDLVLSYVLAKDRVNNTTVICNGCSTDLATINYYYDCDAATNKYILRVCINNKQRDRILVDLTYEDFFSWDNTGKTCVERVEIGSETDYNPPSEGYNVEVSVPPVMGTTPFGLIASTDLPASGTVGSTFYLTDKKMPVYWNGLSWVTSENVSYSVPKAGPYASRPSGADIYIGFTYFATDLNKAIIWDGGNWRNADGSALSGALPTEGQMYVVNNTSIFDPDTVPLGYVYFAQDLGANFYFGKLINEELFASINPSGGRVLNKTNDLTENKRYAIRATRDGVIIKFFKEATGEYDTFVGKDDALNKYAAFTAPDPTVYTSIRIEYTGTNPSVCNVYLAEIDLRWFEEDGVVGVYRDQQNQNKQTLRRGTWAQKPNSTYSALYIGFRYFCTNKQTAEGATNGIEIIYKGQYTTDPANPVDIWVDALGRVVE